MINYNNFENVIEKYGKLVYTNVGVSMMPLIRQKNYLIHIEKTNGRLKKYDVPLYKTKTGKYVLHRIIEVTDSGYVICGDNCITKEYDITDKEIIGVLVGVTEMANIYTVKNKSYLFYVHLWCDFINI